MSSPAESRSLFLTWKDECDHLPKERLDIISQAADEMAALRRMRDEVAILFVCTHNSRRSQFAQAWAHLAAVEYKLTGVHAHSCGTEVTACNARTIGALRRAGWQFSEPGIQDNPIYRGYHANAREYPIVLFSKTFAHPTIPKQGIYACMCCDHADANCPTIPGAEGRIALSYVDPKTSDDQPDEASVYDARCKQIAIEMLALMKRLTQLTAPRS